MSTIKVSINMSVHANDLVEEICKENHLTKSEFIRRAMALMTYTMDYKKKGGHLAVLDTNDKKLADVIGI